MDYKLLLFVLFSTVLTVSCKNLENVENATASAIDLHEGLFTKGRSQNSLIYSNLISCAMRYDTGCFVDVAGEYFEERKNELLAEADLAALKATGRSNPESKPSQVAKSLEKLLSELSGLFKNTLLSYFSGREGDDDDEVVDIDENNNGTSRETNGEYRAHKKKKKLKQILKYSAIAAAIATKINFLFKLFHASLQLKLFLVSFGGLMLHLVKFWLDVKRGYNPPKIVYYEPSHHSHYDGDDGGYWARQYDEKDSNVNVNSHHSVYPNKKLATKKSSYLPYNNI